MRMPFHAVLFVTLAACSSSSNGSSGSTTPCNQNPWECPSAQTCWPQSATAFACLNAGPGKLGDPCVNTVDSPTCGAGLACLQSATASMGTCVAYCSTTDESHACGSGDVCATAALGGVGGPEFSVCTPSTGSGVDAGSDAAAEAASDAGSHASSDASSDAPADASRD